MAVVMFSTLTRIILLLRQIKEMPLIISGLKEARFFTSGAVEPVLSYFKQ